MRIPFQDLPDDARIWIYQADRALSGAELHTVQMEMEAFLETWAAHGAELRTAYKVEHNRFLFIGLDESSVPPSGCSIDASVRVIKDLNNQLGIDFLNRMKITFMIEGQVQDLSISDFQKELKSHSNPQDLVVFNNLIDKKSDLAAWQVPVKDSWHKQWL